jgi:hypothetical protein
MIGGDKTNMTYYIGRRGLKRLRLSYYFLCSLCYYNSLRIEANMFLLFMLVPDQQDLTTG